MVTKGLPKRKQPDSRNRRPPYCLPDQVLLSVPIATLIKMLNSRFVSGFSHDFSEVPQSQTAASGEILRLTCSIDAIPSAQITWTKNDQLLPQNGNKYLQAVLGSSRGVLYVLNLAPEDSGNYRFDTNKTNSGCLARGDCCVNSPVLEF